jgi:hypothetical protein
VLEQRLADLVRTDGERGEQSASKDWVNERHFDGGRSVQYGGNRGRRRMNEASDVIQLERQSK